MTKAINVEVFIIGAGSAGIYASNLAIAGGKQVVIAGGGLPGGSYCLGGGITLKGLLQFSSAYDKYKSIDSCAIVGQAHNGQPDFKRVQKYLETSKAKAVKLYTERINRENITYLDGTAKFVSENSISVTEKDGNETIYNFKKCLIATGSKNVNLPAAVGKKFLDTSSLASISSVPGSVCIVGGGLLGIEMASFFARLGSKVNIIEKGSRILTNVDADIVKKLEETLKKMNVTIFTDKTIVKIERVGQKSLIFFDDISIEGEEIFISIGKKPFVEALNLESAGVQVVDGVPVFDKFLQTTNPNIYVAGDVTDILRQNAWAHYSASVAIKNMVGKKIEYNLASCLSLIASEPTIALTGLSENAAKKAGYDVGILKYSCGDTFSFPNSSAIQTYIKAVYDKSTKTFLGVEAIGAGASEIVSSMMFIIQNAVSPLKTTIYGSAIFNEFFYEAGVRLK